MTQIKEYKDLTKVALDKLYKLRSVATDYCIEINEEHNKAKARLVEIENEISKRHGNVEAN